MAVQTSSSIRLRKTKQPRNLGIHKSTKKVKAEIGKTRVIEMMKFMLSFISTLLCPSQDHELAGFVPQQGQVSFR
jgi:hypothetical protein